MKIILTHTLLPLAWANNSKKAVVAKCSCGAVSESVRPETGMATDVLGSWHHGHLDALAA